MYKKSHSYRKERIAAYLREHTEALLDREGSSIAGLDAPGIAAALDLDRANVSRDLNALYHDSVALKLLGKPTRYLHYQALTDRYPDRYIPNTIPLGQTLKDYITEEPPHKKPAADPSQPVTLVQDQFPSLRLAATQAEAAIHYPPYGLHTLLVAPYGSGKYRFARQMFAYGKAIGRFPADARLYTFDAHSFATSPQALIIQLFGCAAGATSSSAPARKGLVERAQGGMLLLTEVQALPLSVQEKLIDLILYGTFTRFGEAAVNRQCKLMLVATCSQPPAEASHAPLLRYFPMHIPLPPLSKRTVREHFLYLYQAFQEEARDLDCEFHVTKDVFYCLLCTTAGGDLVTLRGNVKSVCSMAHREYLSSPSHHIFPVEYRHLPAHVLEYPDTPAAAAEFRAILHDYPYEYVPIHANSIPLELTAPKNPPRTAAAPLSAESSSLLFIKNYLDEYLRSASEHPQSPSPQSDLFTTQILRCIQEDPVLGKLTRLDPLVQGLVSLLAEIMQTDLKYQFLQLPDNLSLAREIPSELRLMAGALERQLCHVLGLSPSEPRIALLALYFYFIRNRLTASRIHIVFLFHGRGVSRGLASYVGTLCGCTITPLDFDEGSTSESLLASIDAMAADLPSGTQILLFTDGLPFHTIHTYLERQFGFHVKNICGAPYESILQMVRSVTSFYFTLEMVELDQPRPAEAPAPAGKPASIMSQAVRGVLAPSLSFIDLDQLLPLLEDSLAEINRQLKLTPSDNIALKYQFHCSHMIERLIRKEPLDYPRLKSFINAHSQVFRTIGEALQPIAQAFGIRIPTSEIAYLAEIFLAM